MDDLDRLIEAVEAGTAGWYDFPAMCEAVWGDGEGQPNYMDGIRLAYQGSLDAALHLHNSLMPRTSQYSIVTDPTCLCVKVAGWPNGLGGDIEIQGEGWDESNPARAWLLAILRAVKAQQSPGGGA